MHSHEYLPMLSKTPKSPKGDFLSLRISKSGSCINNTPLGGPGGKNLNKRLTFIITSLLLLCSAVSAQYYETGQDPSFLKWKQIKTGRFNVIFPERYEKEGLKYARELDEAYSKMTSLFPDRKFKIPVIIHNYTIESNGYVAWAPDRIELYPTPEQNTCPILPEKQLALHEMTHVLQMESLTRGFSGAMTVIFGQQFTGIVSAMLPFWLLEGDAVYAESILSESGRGRTPAFQKEVKALLVDGKKKYSYDKIINGSYRNFVPDYYQTGYQMVTWALEKKDPHIWNRAFNTTSEEPFLLNPVNISLRSSGLTKKSLWKEASDSLKQLWTKEITENNSRNYPALNPEKKGKYLNYYSPVYAGKNNLIAIKTSLYKPTSIVLIDQPFKKEKRLYIPGQINPWFLSYGNGKLVWVESKTDPRWENREYSVIKIMDVSSRRVKTLSRKSRYVSAAVSPDGRTIVAISNDVVNNNSIVFIDAATGNAGKNFIVPRNDYLQHPQWNEKGDIITFISLNEKGEGIVSFDRKSSVWNTLIEPERNDLQSSFLKNDSLFFISSASGTDNLYVKAPDGRIIMLTKSKFGISDATPGNMIYFSNYTAQGNDISAIGFRAPEEKNKVSGLSSLLINRTEPLRTAEPDTSRSYKTVPYRKWQHLFRFHSWMPFYADIDKIQSDPTSIRPGFTILSQNSLSTLTTTLGYEYSQGKRSLFHSKVAWKGWYPVFESQLVYNTRPSVVKMGENVPDPSGIATGMQWESTISLPLKFTSGKFYEFFRPSVSANYQNQYIYYNGAYDHGQTLVTSRIYFSNYHSSALRDIYPRWAQVIDFNYLFAPFDRKIYGSSTALQTTFYFPGFFRNNGIKIRAEYEIQQNDKFLYGNFASLPRGYSDIISKDYRFLSADYVMPLLYPDFNLDGLFYIKRIRNGFFYDYAEGPQNKFYEVTPGGIYPFGSSTEKITLHSFGFELLADFFVLRVPYMISGGVQGSWKNISEPPTFRVLFNIDLFGLNIGKRKL